MNLIIIIIIGVPTITLMSIYFTEVVLHEKDVKELIYRKAHPNNSWPRHYYSRGTFTNTVKCDNCKTVYCWQDACEFQPCPKCGEKLRSNGPAKWSLENKAWKWRKPQEDEKE